MVTVFKKQTTTIKSKVMAFLKDAHRIGRLPLSIWFAWGLFAYLVVPFISYGFGNDSRVLGPSMAFFADQATFKFFAAYRGAISLLLALTLSFYGGWRGVRKYGAGVKSVFATAFLGGILMGVIFVGGTILLEYVFAAGFLGLVMLAIIFAISTILLSLFLAVFASIGAFAAKEVG